MKFIGSPHIRHKNKIKKYQIVESYCISSIYEFSIKQFILLLPFRSCFYTFSCESTAINSAAFNVLHSAAALLKSPVADRLWRGVSGKTRT